MPNSFRYLLSVTGLVAILFAAISAWPLFSNWLRLRTSPPAPTAPVVAQPAPPLSTGVSPGSGHSRSIPTQVRPLPQPQEDDDTAGLPPNARNIRPVSSGGYFPGNWTTGDGEDSLGECIALDSITLYNRPGGDPLFPASLNRSPLSIGKGTHLGMIRKEGNWLLVHSTFSTTGWVHKDYVSDMLDMPTLQ